MTKAFMTLFDEIDNEVANRIVSWIIESNMEPKETRHKHLNLIINSRGGSIRHGIGIINSMLDSEIPVHTTCIGTAASMAAHVFLQGEPGCRIMRACSSLIFHSPLVNFDYISIEQAPSDIEDTSVSFYYLRRQVAQHSKIPLCDVKKEFMGPMARYVYVDEAIRLGLCDNEPLFDIKELGVDDE